jgi:drug/metabolite transporter (DMT)-like permease
VRARIWIAIVVSSVGWGTAGIATRAALREGVGPYSIIGLRILMAATAVFAYRLARRRPLPGRSIWRLGAVIGLTNITAPYILFTLAVQHASAGFLGLIITNIPLATAVWAHYLLPDEKLNRAKALGLSLAVAGVALLLVTGDSGLAEGGRAGLSAALALGGVVVASFGGVHARRHAPDHDVLDLAGPQFALGAAVLIPLMLAVEGWPGGISAAGWGLVAYMALAGTFMPFLLFFWMLQRVSATTASLPSYLIPVIALAGGALLLDEQVTWLMAAGGALILAGVVFTERAARALPAAGPGPELAPGRRTGPFG